ncbi:MAG: hypothetical protein AAF806_23570 [Bacteroidota bacterium]
MNIATVLHRTAMEFYDLANIYEAKGDTSVFEDYRNRAWLMEKEAAFQMLSKPKDYTFKYLVIQSAGQIGFELKHYEAAKHILELGLLGNPEELERFQMQEILTQIAAYDPKEASVSSEEQSIEGTLTSASLDQNTISIRDSKNKASYSIAVPAELIKNQLRFYLGEWVKMKLVKDKDGQIQFKGICRKQTTQFLRSNFFFSQGKKRRHSSSYGEAF